MLSTFRYGGAACALLAAALGCANDDQPAPQQAAGASSHAGAGAGGNGGAARPPDEECPKQNGENPSVGALCATVDNTCSVRDACGVCVYDASCDYYEDGPVWEFADPLQNTDRPECPASLPVIDSPCTVSFISPYRPVCEYCDGATPVFAACLEYRWRSVTFDYCP